MPTRRACTRAYGVPTRDDRPSDLRENESRPIAQLDALGRSLARRSFLAD